MNQCVIITGATSGIGEACARRFAQHGARLVLTGRRKERLEALKTSLNVPVHLLALDMRDKQAVLEAVEGLPAEFAEIDVLVNNAGLALGMGAADESDLDDWEQMIDTNIKGVLYCTHAILPGMVARDRGHIINLGSVAGTYPYPGGNVYGGTKAFLNHFSLELRADLLGKNIRVTSIEPGMVETEFSKVRFHGDEAQAKAVYSGMQPLTAEDIAESVYWCASQPAHVNINRLELMPVMQAFSPFAVKRKT